MSMLILLILSMFVAAQGDDCVDGQLVEKVIAPGGGNSNDNFGESLSFDDGQAMIVTWDEVYVYDTDGEDWVYANQRLTASDGEDLKVVGHQGDVAIMGAPNARGGSPPGAAYVFRRDGAGQWLEEQILAASDAEPFDDFGHSVAVDGNLAVVGAPQSDDAGSSSGSAYVFECDGDEWREKTKLVASDAAALNSFGFAVAVSSHRILVNALQENSDGPGTVYVFEKIEAQWTETAKFTGSDSVPGDTFGASLAIRNDTILAGASRHGLAGTAYVLEYDGRTWQEVQRLLPDHPSEGLFFGRSCDIDGEIIAIGAYQPNGGSGIAYLFHIVGDTWLQRAVVAPFDGHLNMKFGWTIGLNGSQVLVGAPGDNHDGTNTGSAYAYTLNPNMPCTVCDDCNENGIPDKCESDCNENGIPDDCDIANGTSEDCNQDGIPDECGGCNLVEHEMIDRTTLGADVLGDVLAIGLPYYDVGDVDVAGAVEVYRYDGQSWTLEHLRISLDPDIGGKFGSSVAMQGDLALIGAPGESTHDVSFTGLAYLFRFDPDTPGQWDFEAKFESQSQQTGDQFGWAVDLDGQLAVVGAPAGNGGEYTYIFRRDGETWDSGFRIDSPQGPDGFGEAVAVDEASETVVVGARRMSIAGEDRGAAFVYRPNGDGIWLQDTMLMPLELLDEGAEFGAAVAIRGGTVLVGAPEADEGATDSGAVYVFEFNAGQWEQTTILRAPDAAGFDHFGYNISSNDNLALIGAPGYSGGGAVFAFALVNGQWQQQAVVRTSDSVPGESLGEVVALNGSRAVVGKESSSTYVYHGLGDCNANGEIDACDIARCISLDDNGDGMPDECELPPAAVTRVASVLIHDEGGPNEAPRFHELIAANGIEPRRGGPRAVYFESAEDVDAATADPENVNVTCLNQAPAAHSVYLFDSDIFVVEFDEALADQDCCTIDYAGLRTVSGAPIVGPFDVRSLEGDMNFSGGVTGGDALLIKTHFGEAVDPFAPHWDFDRSGFVTGGDYALIKPRFGNIAPACP